jgi:hypothetical protein
MSLTQKVPHNVFLQSEWYKAKAIQNVIQSDVYKDLGYRLMHEHIGLADFDIELSDLLRAEVGYLQSLEGRDVQNLPLFEPLTQLLNQHARFPRPWHNAVMPDYQAGSGYHYFCHLCGEEIPVDACEEEVCYDPSGPGPIVHNICAQNQ